MMKAYAAYNINESERTSSSSGGVFSALAEVFEVIYGVSMDEKCEHAIYKRIDNGDISELKGSKYLQAFAGSCFANVKKDLQDGRKVLFVGTICQVNALIRFLDNNYCNLCTIDIVCEGVPSQLLWDKFKEDYTVNKVSFRSKELGWKNYGMKINDVFIPKEKNFYMKLYVTNLALRPSCYECMCKTDKKSDITLGDFWGIEKICPSMDDNKGISLMILRTDEAMQLIEVIGHNLIMKEVNYKMAVKYNPAEYSSFKKPPKRSRFFKDIKNKSFIRLYKKYAVDGIFSRIWLMMKKIVKKYTIF